jgi:hypothetical protein
MLASGRNFPPGNPGSSDYNNTNQTSHIRKQIPMSKASCTAHLADHKLKLADKYDRRSRAANSRPLKAKLLRLADKYRRQAKQFGAK